MTLQNGMKIEGSTDGVKFTGHIYELNGVSTFLLDYPIFVRGNWHHDRLYMSINHETGRSSCDDRFHGSDYVRSIPDKPGSEYELLPLSGIVTEHIRKTHKLDSLAIYTASIERALTTYKTVKKTVVCEYGHKHTIDSRQAIKPRLNSLHVGITYFFYALAVWADMQQEIEYQTRQNTWHNLAGMLALCKWGQLADYTGLDPASVAAHKSALDQIYTDTCSRAIIAIFGTTGPYLNRYLSSLSARSSSRANIERILGGKVTPEGVK